MHRTKKLIPISILGFVLIGSVFAQIPDNYQPNYEIQNKYNKIINELFVEIQAKTQIGQTISPTVFAELNRLFKEITPYLPNKYSFNIIYQQCLTLSETLAGGYNLNTLGSFMDNCFKSFVKTVDEINKDYTIKAAGSISPISGPAPLTVTLDARASTDPSNQTIPNDNFFRFYRDIAGVDRTIGRGNVLNHTFEQEGNYKVHLTVRSSNKNTQGILDGSQIFSVDVTPRSANIVTFANGQRLQTTQTAKLGLQEGQRGIVLDGSATTARGGRTLTNHRRNITGPNGFSAIREGQGPPSTLRVVLPEQGQYRISITIFDNQNNQLTENYTLAISDPVAIIKQTPEIGNSSVIYSFDAGVSYSITSRIRLFTWEFFDTEGNRIDTFQGKSINKKFARPGSYTVRLTVVDELGKENSETRQLFVESTPPVAQFIATSTTDLLHPSEFLLDAAVSSDIDVDNNFDTLQYEWEFSSPTTQIIETIESGKKVRITFNEIGKHTVKLTVIDSYGKANTITKDFDIKSTLRPKIAINPKAVTRGNQVIVVGSTNKPVLGYEWDFGDGSRRTIQDRNTTHRYNNVGVYTIKLKVQNGIEENEVRTNIFVGERDNPIPAYVVENAALNMIMLHNDSCVDGDKQVPAYRVDRYQNILINSNDSVNTRGEKTNLSRYFQPRNDQIFGDTGGRFPYRFNDLGCQYIEMRLEDTTVSRMTSTKIRFRVVNALPTIDNIVLSYPQFGNDSGIGFQQASAVQQDIFSSSFDPLIVRVSAINAKDTDGNIAYFQRYYYQVNDPGRVFATKLSPGDVPYTFFSLPKEPGEFMFGVRVFDSDGGSQRSEDIIGNGPVVFFPPDTSRPDIPMVTLTVDKASVEVGEEVTFNVFGRILSERPDFIQERVIQYDFDGDGEYDLTTKSDRVTYVYTKPNENGFTPRASIVYRGYRGVARGENIVVKNGLRPRLLFSTSDTLTLVRDVSLGDIEGKQICMDARYCQDPVYINTGKDDLGFIFNYPDYGKYVVSMDVYDKNANNVAQRRPIEIQENTGALQILSIPETSNINEIPEIFVGKNLDNSVLFYIKYNNPTGICYIDTNIHYDSNKDDNTEQDKDFACNQVHLEKYTTSYENIIGRIYFENEGTLNTQDFVVTFLDFELELDDKTRVVYDLINKLLETIDPNHEANIYLIEQLISLRENILDKNDTKAILVGIQDTINTQDVRLSSIEKENIEKIMRELEDRSVTAALGGSIYDQAKAEIINILPHNLASDIRVLFYDFENAIATPERTLQEVQKDMLQQIVAVIGKSVANDNIDIGPEQLDPDDMQYVIIPNICIITEFFSIPTESCEYDNETLKPIPGNINDDVSGGLKTWIKILIGIFVVVVVGFIGLVILFAIKAKMRGDDEGEQEEYTITEPETTINQTETIQEQENTDTQNQSTQNTDQ